MFAWFSKKLGRLVDAHRQHAGDRAVAVAHGQRLAVELPAVANRAGDKQVGQKPHFDPLHALALAFFAAAALGIKTKAAHFVAKLLGVFGAGKDAADFVKNAGVRRRVRAGRAANRRLVDMNQPVEFAHPTQRLVRAGPGHRAVQFASQRAGQRVDYQRTFARATHAGHASKRAEREIDANVLQIIVRRPFELQHARLGDFAAFGRCLDFLSARKICASDRFGMGSHLVGCAFGNNLPAARAGAGADVDQPVGGAHHFFIMLDDKHRIALLLQVAQRFDQSGIVARVQADRGFVENVQHADQPRADASRQPNPLHLAATERIGRPVEREIMNTNLF